jgi:phosphoglycolate phosphatase-like HAD superfamily hydrolase
MNPIQVKVGEVAIKTCCVVYDKDGTLVDFNSVWGPLMVHSANALLAATDLGDDFVHHLYRAVGYDPKTNRTLGQGPLATAPLDQLVIVVATAMFQSGITWDKALEFANTYLLPLMAAQPTAKEIAPRGDVLSSLQALQQHGCRLGVATTDNRESTHLMLRHLGIQDCLSQVICCNDPGPVKPDPKVLVSIARTQKIPVSQLIMVGDTVSDMVMSRRAGAGLSVGITGGAGTHDELAAHADVLIDDISEIRPASTS